MRYGKDKQTEKYIHGIGHESTEKLNQWKETEKTFYTHNELGSQIREYDDKVTTYSTILMRYGKDKQTEKYIHGIGHESTEKLNQWKETERTLDTLS